MPNLRDIVARRWPRLLAMSVVPALVLAACGGGSDDGIDATAEPTEAVDDQATTDDAEAGAADTATDEPADADADEASTDDAGSSGEDSGDEAATDDDGASSEPALSPEEAAEQNAGSLTLADDARETEVLSVVDGSVASLRSVTDGQRPVLLWFWAPH